MIVPGAMLRRASSFSGMRWLETNSVSCQLARNRTCRSLASSVLRSPRESRCICREAASSHGASVRESTSIAAMGNCTSEARTGAMSGMANGVAPGVADVASCRSACDTRIPRSWPCSTSRSVKVICRFSTLLREAAPGRLNCSDAICRCDRPILRPSMECSATP